MRRNYGGQVVEVRGGRGNYWKSGRIVKGSEGRASRCYSEIRVPHCPTNVEGISLRFSLGNWRGTKRKGESANCTG